MSTIQSSESIPPPAATVKSKRKNKKKKGGGGKPEANGEQLPHNGTQRTPDYEEDAEEEADLPVLNHPAEPQSAQVEYDSEATSDAIPVESTATMKANGVPKAVNERHITAESTAHELLETMTRERDALKAEVTELRKALKGIQEKHDEEVGSLRDELDEASTGKDQAETQYNELLGRVNSIRTQLGERLKSYSEELAQSRKQIEELEEQTRGLQEQNETLQAKVSSLSTDNLTQQKEIAELRSRASLSQQNWIKERDELIQREAYAREEFETAKQAMQDWEMLATEERAQRQGLSDRIAELEDQLASHQEALERTTAERDTQAEAVDGLQRALKEIQDARKKELRELVERSQSELDELRKQLLSAEDVASSAQAELQATRKELERALPFEKEVKEKNLLIGKLRHEAVILNDHLTKALRFLKQRKPEDMVDRQLVTNHFLHFITLDRTDPKKFQVLQLIAALLAWTDEQKEQAGLARPGASTAISYATLKLPLSPFRRTPSQMALNASIDMAADSRPGSSKESLAELWSDFLEREAQEGSNSRTGSRDGKSVSSPTLERKESGG